MTFDIPHMIATAVIILAVTYPINHGLILKDATKGRKTLVTFVGIFVLVLILNLIWPYGSGG